MHYYQWNITDYLGHTLHYDDLEDLAYRRMLDLYYLHESPLPEDLDELAKLIRMRTHSDCIATVLKDWFYLDEDGYRQKRADKEIQKYRDKSDKASASAKKRWSKNKDLGKDAKAMRTHSEGNAKHKPINKKQETDNKNIPYGMVIEAYHNQCKGLPIVKNKSMRYPAIKTRWTENTRHQSKEFWEWYFSLALKNPHWMGNNDRDWKADIDFLLTKKNFYKAIEKEDLIT